MSFNNTRIFRKPTEKAKWQVPTRPHNGTGPMEYYLEGDVKEKFCKLFPIHSNRRICTWFGLSYATCHRFARELGLQKDMTAIRREHAKDVKKICEKNGYYDSLRGKRPSDACIEGTRRKRAEGFHPFKQLKKNNPRKYKKVMAKRGERHKDLWESERRRVLYGLEQKTNLRINLNKLSSTAGSQKSQMIRKHNYFADPDHTSWVCYDSQTDRSPRMEATAIKHGLRIVQGNDVDETTND